MEYILGQPTRFALCSRYTVLTDEISKLTRDNTRTLVISCLTGIVASLTTAQDVKVALEKAMTSLGAVLREMVRTNVGCKVYIAPCTPRDVQDFGTHSSFALVLRKEKLSYYITKFKTLDQIVKTYLLYFSAV